MDTAQMAVNQALQGVPQLVAQLRELGQMENGNALRRAVRAGAKPIVDAAKVLAPVSEKRHRIYTGDYVTPGFGKKSIHTEVSLDRSKQKATAYIGPNKRAYYMTQYVERGTSKMPAHPFLRPAFYSKQDEALRNIGKSLQEFMDKVAAKK